MNKKTIEIALRLKDDLSKGLKSAATKATASTRKIGASAKRMGTAFKGAMLSVKGLIAAFLAMAALRKVILWMKDSISLAIIQETAINNMNSALIAMGNYSDETSLKLRSYARTLQRLVGIGDEVTLSLLAMVEGLTGMSADALPKAMRAVISISKLYRGDYQSAAVLLGKTLNSNLNAFARFGIQVDMTGTMMERLDQIVEGTTAGFEIAKREANTFGGAVNILKMAWDDLRETVGFWIGASPGVIEILKTITDKIELMDEAIEEANKSGKDLAGQAFAAIITESMKVIIYLNKAREVAIMTAIGFNKATRAAIKLIPATRAAEARALGTVDANIAGLEKTLVGIIKTELVLENIIDDVNSALAKSKGITIDTTNIFKKLGSTVNDSMNKGAVAVNTQATSFNRLTESLKSFMTLWDKYIASRGGSVEQMFYKHGLGIQPQAEKTLKQFGMDKTHPSYQLGKTIAGLSGYGGMYQPGTAAKGEHAKTGIAGLSHSANLQAMAGYGIQGAMSGGGMGAIGALMPAIGNIIAPGIGGVIGGLVGGLFGKKRRGTTPAQPVYVSDVNVRNSITELLNAVKSQLSVSASGGINRIASQLKSQALSGAHI